jgi:hypothetical protein
MSALIGILFVCGFITSLASAIVWPIPGLSAAFCCLIGIIWSATGTSLDKEINR